MIHLLIRIKIGFFLSIFILILIPQILNGIYGNHSYFVILWLLVNFAPHVLVLYSKRNNREVEYKRLIYGLFALYYLSILLSLLLRPYFLKFGISTEAQLFQSLWALLPIQLIFIFIIFYATKTNEIPTPYDTPATLNKDSFLEKLQELIGDNHIEQAINLSFGFYKKDKDISNDLILLKKRLKAINTKESMGTASLDDAEIERNRVSKALLEVATPK